MFFQILDPRKIGQEIKKTEERCSSPVNIMVTVETFLIQRNPLMMVQGKGRGADVGSPSFRSSLGARVR